MLCAKEENRMTEECKSYCEKVEYRERPECASSSPIDCALAENRFNKGCIRQTWVAWNLKPEPHMFSCMDPEIRSKVECVEYCAVRDFPK